MGRPFTLEGAEHVCVLVLFHPTTCKKIHGNALRSAAAVGPGSKSGLRYDSMLSDTCQLPSET